MKLSLRNTLLLPKSPMRTYSVVQAMKKSELVFVPVPAIGHLKSAILAKLLLDQDERLSITVLVIFPIGETDLSSYIQSLAASDARIKYTMIPPTHHLFQPSSPMCIEKLATVFIESHKPQVEQAVMELLADNSTHLVGFVLDMFCSSMIDVANKFKVPSYIFLHFAHSFSWISTPLADPRQPWRTKL